MRQLTPLRLDTFPNFKRGSVQVHEPAAAASAASLDPRRPPPQQQSANLSHISIDRSRINQLVGRGRARVPTIERKRNGGKGGQDSLGGNCVIPHPWSINERMSVFLG